MLQVRVPGAQYVAGERKKTIMARVVIPERVCFYIYVATLNKIGFF